jgi:hypothetical protein
MKLKLLTETLSVQSDTSEMVKNLQYHSTRYRTGVLGTFLYKRGCLVHVALLLDRTLHRKTRSTLKHTQLWYTTTPTSLPLSNLPQLIHTCRLSKIPIIGDSFQDGQALSRTGYYGELLLQGRDELVRCWI